MAENTVSINKKTIISLARNTPVALVVGAGGFLGSHLVDKLLTKNIQVVGVDNFKTGKKEYLEDAVKDKNFHLVISSADELDLDLERLDYLFIVTEESLDIKKVLEIFKTSKCKCLFVSTIDLYQSDHSSQLNWFKQTEGQIAQFAKEHNLNARVLRLGSVYGPRMHFRDKDAVTKLIQDSLTGDLQKEISLEFSTRALFIDDATNLMIKSMLSGSTALKIFDGVSDSPIKVSEIKQILLDPLWYEHRSFTPSELPPWPTPNLEKTQKLLNWYPKQEIVKFLRQTLAYFRDNEITVPKQEKEPPKQDWKKEKEEELKALKMSLQKEDNEKEKKGSSLAKFSLPLSKIYLVLIIILLSYSIVWPIFAMGWGILTFRYQLSSAEQDLKKGEFEKSLIAIQQAKVGVEEAKTIYNSLEPLRNVGFLKSSFEVGDSLEKLSNMSILASQGTILGVQSLFQGLKSVTGEINEVPGEHFSKAQIQLAQADENIQAAEALLKNDQFRSSIPEIFKDRIESLENRLLGYSDLIKKGRAFSVLLPQVIGLEKSKSYLILLQNNNELRPTGGFIGSFAKVTFEGGKLKKLDVSDVYSLDGQLKIHVEPPKEIINDLGQKDWYLRDSNWEPDFPTSAKQAQWFYNKESGEMVDGVIALDIVAIENLLAVLGPIDLPDYKEKITSDNLFEKAISYAESSFFAGSQGKKNFLTSLTNALFNKIFFLHKQNWPGIVQALGASADGKHLSIFLDDPKLFSYLISQNWSSTLPRPAQKEEGIFEDFLAPVEANLGANKANYYLDRSYNLETVIGKEGHVHHRLRINYVNRSPSLTWPAGKYKNRFRVYLPFGTKLNRALWGETDITKNVESFVDYGRTGYSVLLELNPKEQKVLVLDYELSNSVEFKGDTAVYNLNIVKQAGTHKDPFEWKISYPLNLKVVSGDTKEIGPQERTISTDLSLDRRFEIVFKK